MITFENAFAWLNQFDQQPIYLGQPSYLSESAQLLLGRINEARIAWDFRTLRDRIADLIAICDSLKRELEPAEARLRCAREWFLCNGYWSAAPLLRQAISGYHSHRHNQAIAHWMLGYVLWQPQLPDRREEAIVEWNRSIEVFTSLRDVDAIGKNRVNWYSLRLLEMNASLPEAISSYGFP